MSRAALVPLAILLVAITVACVGRVASQDGRTASREPVGLAPDPAATPGAVVQVYGARALGVKGLFGVHTWVAVKPAGAREYTVYEIMGWRLRWGDTALVVRQRRPDAPWFGAEPELLADRRGPEVDALIERVKKAVDDYPWSAEYTLWPGPNSNTFTAWIGRAVPELELDLPATAIGKDYTGTRLFGAAPSGSGLQFSLFGLAGITASGVEGLEINLLGLSFGINPLQPALKLPLIGRIGPSRSFGPALAPDIGQP